MLDDQESENSQLRITALHRAIGAQTVIRIGTLGPEGTSSHRAATHLIRRLETSFHEKLPGLQLRLCDSFDLVIDCLLSSLIDMAVVPNAYEGIGGLYWDRRLEYVYTYVYDTPVYGLAAKQARTLGANEAFQIASCPAVYSLIEQLAPQVKYQLKKVSSTAIAARLVAEHEADLAVTNATSAEAYGLVFVSPTFKVDIPWSVFVKR